MKKIDMDSIFELSEDALHTELEKMLVSLRKEPISDKEYLYAPGGIPVLLVAHLDTVHNGPPTICKSADGNILMAPQGIGGDDRAGVWIMQEVLAEFDCHVLFTHGEEVGGIGSHAFIGSEIAPCVNFIIGSDRQGDNDAVFYYCGNRKFIKDVVKATGFKEAFGSFSDISILAPHFGRAAVNLSSGFYRAHDKAEFVRVSDMEKGAEAVKAVIKAMAHTSYNYYSPRKAKLALPAGSQTAYKNWPPSGVKTKWAANDGGYYGSSDKSKALTGYGAYRNKYDKYSKHSTYDKYRPYNKYDDFVPVNPYDNYGKYDPYGKEGDKKTVQIKYPEGEPTFYDHIFQEVDWMLEALAGIDYPKEILPYMAGVVEDTLREFGIERSSWY